MKENLIKTKSFAFALEIIKVCKYLQKEQKEFVLSKQLLRSATSVGANIRESEHAQSKADFIHKLSIAQKEINETIYWLELLTESDYLSIEKVNAHHNESKEILRIITSILLTMKAKT